MGQAVAVGHAGGTRGASVEEISGGHSCGSEYVFLHPPAEIAAGHVLDQGSYEDVGNIALIEVFARIVGYGVQSLESADILALAAVEAVV